MNKQQIIDAAMQMAAGIGGDPLSSPVIDADMTAEDLLPHAFRYAYRQLLINGNISLQDVMRRHLISCFAADSPYEGLQGEMPSSVLNEFLDHSFLPELPYSSFKRYFADYTRQQFANLLCYYTANNGIFYTTCGEPEEGEEVPEAGTNIVLHAPSIPDLSVAVDIDIPMPERARDTVVMTLALALRGELKLVS